MGDSDKHSRLNKHEKRRKNTKLISILLILGAILVIILLGMWIFGGNGEEEMDEQNEQSAETREQEENTESDTIVNEDDSPENDSSDEDAEKEENEDQETKEEASEDDDEVETEQAEPSDDNVSEAYTGNWDPVGTEQEGSHTTDYSDGSQDRIEIDQAASVATGLDESSMSTFWVGNGGDQQVIATVGNADQEEYYRVFLSWVDNEGWQPTTVEMLNELDY
ncbi:DUF1510 family protein [Virgibacillus natechei]|uniref:YrrS family protein n=1 Tax=Virgibacillus sp. CBA3643 TaxID=2942278 RepID=UPI0035A2D576